MKAILEEARKEQLKEVVLHISPILSVLAFTPRAGV